MKRKNEFDDNIDISDDFDMESADDEEEQVDFSDAEDSEYADFVVDTEGMDEFDESDFGVLDETAEDLDEEEMTKHRGKAGKIGLIILGVILIFAIWAVGTDSGRSFCLRFVAKFVHNNVGTENDDELIRNDDIPENEVVSSSIEIDQYGNVIIHDQNGDVIEKRKDPRSEDYVKTYLIFGLEQIDGAANTDALMLVSINTKDETIKLTSLLRDTYVMIPGWYKDKLNSAYAKGAHGASTGAEARANGAALLVRTIEDTYDVEITGYASVNFSSFEKIINRLGGIDIELGEEEAHYLNTTNYISEPAYRDVVPGWNHLNGNQAMGYVRVRKTPTLGGANNDYGRTVRQRRVINAIIKQYKSSGLLDILSITKDCLGYINTNMSENQIQEALTMVVNNGIFTTKSMRLPADEYFYDSDKAGINNGVKNVTYALVIDDYLDKNIELFHQFLFLDEPKEKVDSSGQ